MSEPKIEIVAAPQTRRNAAFRQSGEPNGLRTRAEHIAQWCSGRHALGGISPAVVAAPATLL